MKRGATKGGVGGLSLKRRRRTLKEASKKGDGFFPYLSVSVVVVVVGGGGGDGGGDQMIWFGGESVGREGPASLQARRGARVDGGARARAPSGGENALTPSTQNPF
jgi:hypothetical protein